MYHSYRPSQDLQSCTSLLYFTRLNFYWNVLVQRKTLQKLRLEKIEEQLALCESLLHFRFESVWVFPFTLIVQCLQCLDAVGIPMLGCFKQMVPGKDFPHSLYAACNSKVNRSGHSGTCLHVLRSPMDQKILGPIREVDGIGQASSLDCGPHPP